MVVPNAEGVRRGLARDDLFTVVHDQFLTDTARYADLVLPATTQIESVDAVPAWGHLWMGWNEPAIAPVGESVSNTELHRRLATAMGFTPDVAPHLPRRRPDRAPRDDAHRRRRRTAPRRLGEGAVPDRRSAVRRRRVPHRLGQGRAAQRCCSPHWASRRSPRSCRPTSRPAATPTSPPAIPFALLTPKQHTRFLNSSYSQLPKHGPLEGTPFVEMVAADAERLGVVDGQCVIVHNDRAELELPVKITERLRPGVVAVPWGWWAHQHPDGRTANALTNDTLTDWGGGVAYSSTLVGIRPR